MEAGEEVNPLYLDVGRGDVGKRQVGNGQHDVADGCFAGRNRSKPDGGFWSGEVVAVAGFGVNSGTLQEQGLAVDQSGEGFQKSSGPDNSKCWRVINGGPAQ